MHPQSFDELIPHMRRAGFIATSLAAVITAMFGWQLGENVVASVCLAGLLALCTFIVGYSLVAAYHAWKRDMKGVSAAATALFAVAVCVEFLSHTGFTAANRDATIQQASMQTQTYEDSRGNVKDLEAKVARLSDERNVMKPTQSVAAARAVIQTTEAHKWFTGLTQGCKVTKGPQSRAFCERYFAATADIALWDQIAAQEVKLATAESELRSARDTSGQRHAGHAAGASQGLILAAAVTQTERPSESAQFWTGVGISALLALFAICAGGLLNFIAFAFEPVREVRKAAAATLQEVKDDALKLRRVTLAQLSEEQGLKAA